MATQRDSRIRQEAAALWRELYQEPPPAAEGADLLDMIVGGLPEPSYDRIANPHLRPANISFPKR
ncbi:MAG: hypothetical protein JNK30_00310 [Phenylobacterium sp.]|uniref:hypothetical protein n=1 Tax=Phenylobacterium sp. TaxID=1871053 RepID=UPI001A56A32D|nr:hypothetical protein [Phenylobacterium sp.]MBL8769795.1 hypothetical protein [Phenylobacterium sp.]